MKSYFGIGCPPVKLLHIFRTPFLSNPSGGLLLQRHSNKVQYHAISLISFWASKVIVMCYKSFYRNSWYFFLSEFFCKSMVLLKRTMPLDRWRCCENYIPGLFAFIQFEIWLNFILIIAKWKLLVQLSSASLPMIRDNSLMNDLFRITIEMLCFEVFINSSLYVKLPTLKPVLRIISNGRFLSCFLLAIQYKAVFKLAETKIPK